MNRYMVPDLALEAQVDRRCPRCGGTRSRIHERREHRPRDPWVSQVSKIRMRCVCCGKTWTLAPSGLVLHAQRSDRVKVLNVLLYALGLSYRGVSAAMCAFRVIEDKMTVYRDVQLAGSRALARLHRMKRRVSLAGIDGTGQRLAKPRDAHSEDLVFVVDFGDGRLLEAALVDEQDSTAIGELIADQGRESVAGLQDAATGFGGLEQLGSGLELHKQRHGAEDRRHIEGPLEDNARLQGCAEHPSIRGVERVALSPH